MSNADLKKVSFDLLSKITSVMTDRAAAMKCLDRIFADFIRTELGRDVHVHFLHCNAHFLLGMSSACEKAISKVEKELESERQQKFGRDQNAKYDGFNEGSESSVSRVIRTACDILGPRGDQKSGCRVQWTTFIANSVIPYFKGNRFNCFFEAVASLIFHLPTMVQFFSSGVLHENPNRKIHSVSPDVQDKTLMCMVCAVALFFIKITGPYWKLINSDVKYFNFHLYLKKMVTNFEKWIDDPSDLLSPNFFSVFDGDLVIKAPRFH